MEAALAPAAAVAGLVAELRLFSPSRGGPARGAILWAIGWLLAVAVAVAIALSGGPAGEWTTVYLIERSLSLDNVFLFSLLLMPNVPAPVLRSTSHQTETSPIRPKTPATQSQNWSSTRPV